MNINLWPVGQTVRHGPFTAEIGVRFSYGSLFFHITGCSVAWLARLIWDQEVAGSNPVTPTLTFLVSPVAEGKTVGFIYCKIKSNIGIICISSSAG